MGTRDPLPSDECGSSKKSNLEEKQGACRNLHLYEPFVVSYILVSSCHLRTQCSTVVEYCFLASSECALGINTNASCEDCSHTWNILPLYPPY